MKSGNLSSHAPKYENSTKTHFSKIINIDYFEDRTMNTASLPRKILFGTDWWTDCDDTAALRLVCRYAKQDIWQPMGVILNAAAPYAAASVKAVLIDEGFGDVPIGIDLTANDYGGRPPYQYAVASAAGTTDIRNEDCENGVSLYRRLLTDADDGTVELLEVGYLPVLAGLLTSEPDEASVLSGIELVRAKVSHIWCMGGNWERDGIGQENNFCRNRRASEAAHTVLSLCPIPMTFLGYEIGEDVIAHPPLNSTDLIRIAFDTHGSSHGRCAWDPMLVHLAAFADPTAAGYTTVNGIAAVNRENGENHFFVTTDGQHRYVKKKHEPVWYTSQIDKMLQ